MRMQRVTQKKESNEVECGKETRKGEGIHEKRVTSMQVQKR